jgi:Cof subfamily protein (haloacid dehalogenase superfamily)
MRLRRGGADRAAAEHSSLCPDSSDPDVRAKHHLRHSGHMIPPASAPPRVIATDLDRTLLRSDGTTSQRTRDALDLAASQGTHILAVTARPIRWLERLIPQFGLLPHVIASNGALCFDLADGIGYDFKPFAPESLPELLDALRKALPDAGFALETRSGLAREDVYEVSPFDPDDADPGRRVGAVAELLAGLGDDPVLKIVVADRDRTSDAMFADAAPAVAGLADLTYSTNRGLLELGPPGVTKATTLAAWCAARSITADEVLAFGDMPNDLPMLRWAGRSYAVANAHPDVLAAARGVTGTNDEDGVAAIVEELFAS